MLSSPRIEVENTELERTHNKRAIIEGILSDADNDQPDEPPIGDPALQPVKIDTPKTTDKPNFFPVKPPKRKKKLPKEDDRYRWN